MVEKSSTITDMNKTGTTEIVFVPRRELPMWRKQALRYPNINIICVAKTGDRPIDTENPDAHLAIVPQGHTAVRIHWTHTNGSYGVPRAFMSLSSPKKSEPGRNRPPVDAVGNTSTPRRNRTLILPLGRVCSIH